MRKSKMSRRKFLQAALAATAGAAAVACQPKTVVVKETVEVKKEVTRVVEKPAPKGKKEIRILLSSWAIVEMPFDMMAREYNEKNPEVEVKFETTFEGWDTKVIGQIRADKLEWSGAGIMTPFLNIVQWTETGMIQPMEEYINASTEEGASQVLTDMIKTVKDDASYKGHLYGMPYSFENITYQWRTDLFGEAGVTESPKTWDDWYEYCTALKKHLEEQGKKDIYTTAFDPALWRSLGGLICSASDNPYTEEGLIDWDSDAMRAALKFVRKMVFEGLTPPGGGETADLYDMWQRGRLASLMSCSSRGVWAQNIFGPEKVETARIPTIDGKPHSGSAFWGNCLTVLNKSPYPQEVTDFYIYAMGPQNKRWQKAAIKSGKTPVYNSAYDEILKTDPMFNMYKWMLTMREDVEASVPVPRNTYYLIQNTAWQKWRVEFLKEGSTMTEDELIQHVLEDTRAEIAKQKL